MVTLLYENTTITSVSIPASVTAIDRFAFYGCSNLASVTFASGSQLTTIVNYAFQSTAITSIAIPAGVTSIGYPFAYCSSLAAITVAEGNTAYKAVDGVLYSYDGKTLMQYPIGSTASSFTIPSGVETVSTSAFSGSAYLTGVTIASTVTAIGAYAFNSCTKLTSITIPAGVTTIGNNAFQDCTNLASVTFASGSQLTTINDYVFYKTAITSITIPAGVTKIGIEAFKECTNLTSITIPAGVTKIGIEAFVDCDSLQTVTFENTVGWYYTYDEYTGGDPIDVSDPYENAINLAREYYDYYWYREA